MTKVPPLEIKPSKYKVGDYLTGEHMVYLEIVAVINDTKAEQTIYGCLAPPWDEDDYDKLLTWTTEWQLDFMGLALKQPDFTKWQSIAVGDVVFIDATKGSRTHHILSRVGDMVLLSATPKSQKEKNHNNALKKQLEDLAKEMEDHSDMAQMAVTARLVKEVIPEQTEWDEKVEKMLSGTNAYKIPGRWVHINNLAKMNWQLMKE